ncbi:MAG TPA: DinB family protein [Gemmatimonadaceae bacterium]|nr:DinB family protein [Gemmatimonadaceae bacterium]
MLPCVAAAQTAPVAEAFKQNAQNVTKNLIASAEEMPADKYSYAPTPAQMSFAHVVTHLIEGNDYLCGKIGGTTAPTRTKVDTTSGKEALVARLKETFQFCEQSLASLDDSKLNEKIPFFGGKPWTRAAIMTLTTGDWADHYSQSAIYLRLNGLLPPSAKKASM